MEVVVYCPEWHVRQSVKPVFEPNARPGARAASRDLYRIGTARLCKYGRRPEGSPELRCGNLSKRAREHCSGDSTPGYVLRGRAMPWVYGLSDWRANGWSASGF
jgi:hypothetical protein